MSNVPNRAGDPSRKAGTHNTSLNGQTTQEVLEGMMSSVGAKSIKDPFTGTVHVDLSDPEHPFWKGMK
jgi:hypothetical protein